MSTVRSLAFCFSAFVAAASAGAATEADSPRAGAPASAAEAGPSRAASRCEAAVAETIDRLRGAKPRDVEFVAHRRSASPASDVDETSIVGEGRYRSASGSVPFSYSCLFNAKSGTTSGVVLRDALTLAAAPARQIQPDLTNLSPAACESAAASLLKNKFPRLSRLTFDSETRRAQGVSASETSLEGQGALQRAPGMNAAAFRYRCDFDNRSGRVVRVQAE